MFVIKGVIFMTKSESQKATDKRYYEKILINKSYHLHSKNKRQNLVIKSSIYSNVDYFRMSIKNYLEKIKKSIKTFNISDICDII